MRVYDSEREYTWEVTAVRYAFLQNGDVIVEGLSTHPRVCKSSTVRRFMVNGKGIVGLFSGVSHRIATCVACH